MVVRANTAKTSTLLVVKTNTSFDFIVFVYASEFTRFINLTEQEMQTPLLVSKGLAYPMTKELRH